jgi:hypothetical protein
MRYMYSDVITSIERTETARGSFMRKPSITTHNHSIFSI